MIEALIVIEVVGFIKLVGRDAGEDATTAKQSGSCHQPLWCCQCKENSSCGNCGGNCGKIGSRVIGILEVLVIAG